MCTNKIAIAVLRALRRSNPAHHRYNASSNPEALIAEVVIYNAVCMH